MTHGGAEMTTASDNLLAELVALLKKHGATLVEHDDYNSDENWYGSHFSIHGVAEGSELYVTLDEIADALKKEPTNVK